jgi:hypothetical protein
MMVRFQSVLISCLVVYECIRKREVIVNPACPLDEDAERQNALYRDWRNVDRVLDFERCGRRLAAHSQRNGCIAALVSNRESSIDNVSTVSDVVDALSSATCW